jgi:hypothetical protein
MAGENWAMWLNVTNLILGIVTLAALVIVFFAVGWDVLAEKLGRAQARSEMRNIDGELRALLHGGTHTLRVPELGLTMADGGEKIEPSEDGESEKKSQE